MPTPNADWIAKITFDPKAGSRSMHFAVAGLMNRFSFYNSINNRYFSITGGGVALNALLETARHLTTVTSNFYTNDGGDFIFGEAPDLIIQATGAPSLLPAASTVDGLEYEPTSKWTLWASTAEHGLRRSRRLTPWPSRPSARDRQDPRTARTGPSGRSRPVFIAVFWTNPNYGSLRFSGEYSWIVRHPWYVPAGQPASAKLNMVYLGFRYFLPGLPPR